MIQVLSSSDSAAIYKVVNAAAQAYKGVIPDDRWKEPYMSMHELIAEMNAGVRFFGWVEQNAVIGVMGLQSVNDATLLRHSYVLPSHQRKGIGSALLNHLLQQAQTPTLYVGTWRAATWAIRFYEKHGFTQTSRSETMRLLRLYWTIPTRQIETSIVLKRG